MRYFFIALFFLFGSMEADQHKTICLNMIVKDESKVICRCLESVKPIIDYWVICDTGSTDGTQEIIRNFMKDIPGELHERPWVNFEHNRNQALDLAQGKADYVLLIDADEVFDRVPNFVMPDLDKDFYYIMTFFNGTHYARVQLINNHLPWRWQGVLHEYLHCNQAKNCGMLEGMRNIVRTDGARSQDPRKYYKDAEVLKAALKKEPDNSRYVFYLAQSYKDAGEPALALEQYQKRITMGGWEEEIFWSLYQIGMMQEKLEMPEEVVVESYDRAYKYRPSRLEALFQLVRYLRMKGNCREGYLAAQQGLPVEFPKDILFVQSWIYDYEFLLEFSVCAYWIEQYREAQLASLLILSKPNLPNHIKECVERNLNCCRARLAEKMASETPKVSVICPTYNRQDLHENLYLAFIRQTYRNKELLVADDSPAPSPFFATLQDKRVKYCHQPRATIGAKRNTLCEMATGEIIAHFDDDDYYAPKYLEKMVNKLGNADLVKLSKWLAWREKDGTLWEWDTRLLDVTHFVVHGKENQIVTTKLRSQIADVDAYVDKNIWGYGFSYVYRKSLWKECRFENMDLGEDYDFVSRAKSLGKSLIHFPDEEHIVLHTIHPKGTSLIYPQYRHDGSKGIEMLGKEAIPWMVTRL